MGPPVPASRGSGSRSSSSRGADTLLRTRVLRPRWLTVAWIFWAAAWLALPAPAGGAPLPPARAATSDGVAGDSAPSAGEGTTLREALLAQGLTAADADLVLARLTPAERAELAQRVGELGMGGDGGLWVIVLILVLAILLYLPLAGRMQGWW